MSVAVALQDAVLNALKADATVAGLIVGRVYDRIPATAKFPYVSLGPYDFASDDAECIDAGEHTLQVDVWSQKVGRVEAKQITDAVRRALHKHEADLGAYALVEMRVDFTQVIGDPDGLTSHGIVRVTAMIEEPV